jgi:hypothetical protein
VIDTRKAEQERIKALHGARKAAQEAQLCFRYHNQGNSSKGDICWKEYEEGVDFRFADGCQHFFHKVCILRVCETYCCFDMNVSANLG